MPGRPPRITTVHSRKAIELSFNESPSVPILEFVTAFSRLQGKGHLPRSARLFYHAGRITVAFRRPPRTCADRRTTSYKRWRSSVQHLEVVIHVMITSIQAAHEPDHIVERVSELVAV